MTASSADHVRWLAHAVMDGLVDLWDLHPGRFDAELEKGLLAVALARSPTAPKLWRAPRRRRP